MGTSIIDGTGSEYAAEVDLTGKLNTRAVTLPLTRDESINGNHYAVGTNVVNLTSDSASALLYVKNTGDKDLFIDRFIVNAQAAASSTTDFLVLGIYVNPTAMASGSGTDLINTNVNFGSPKTANISSEFGAEGATLTGGTFSGAFVYKKEISTFTDIRIVLPKDASLGLTVTPPAGNTSFNIISFIEMTELQPL